MKTKQIKSKTKQQNKSNIPDLEEYLSGYKSDDESDNKSKPVTKCNPNKIESKIPIIDDHTIPAELQKYILRLNPGIRIGRRRRI